MKRNLLLAIAFYFLYYDPKIGFMKQSLLFNNEDSCEQARISIHSKLRNIDEWNKYWISPQCEIKKEIL